MAAKGDDGRKEVVGWIDSIKVAHGVEIPAIANKARVSASTIYRYYDESYEFSPSYSVLRKIARAWGAALPKIEGLEAPGFAESEMDQIDAREGYDEIVAGPNQGRWRIETRALELAGFVPGDIALFDQTVTPRRGDVVCAQVLDGRGGAITRLRLYQAPYLVTATMDPRVSDQPLYVDSERVTVWGTMVRMLRVRPENGSNGSNSRD